MIRESCSFQWTLLAVFLFSVSCTQKFLSHENSKELSKNKEFESVVKIVEVPVQSQDSLQPAPGTSSSPSGAPSPVKPSDIVAPPPPQIGGVSDKDLGSPQGPVPGVKKTESAEAKKPKKPKKTELVSTPIESSKGSPRRPPDIESDIGFNGRRPLVDPFRVGEKVTHSVNYFAMKAGTLVLETRPYAMVNGVKNYQFRTSIKTVALFDSFYSVDDYVDVLMDFEQLTPSVFTLHVKESAQLKEAQMFFDQVKGKATYWEKKITEKNGEENKKLEWELAPYAQNIFSAAFYMRIFKWEVGKENAFYVADNEKNLIFRAKALRKEKITTAVGEFEAIVIRPEIELKGKYNPVGDNYIWLSDDDRKLILRIESKIKIGTLVSEVIDIQKGLE